MNASRFFLALVISSMHVASASDRALCITFQTRLEAFKNDPVSALLARAYGDPTDPRTSMGLRLQADLLRRARHRSTWMERPTALSNLVSAFARARGPWISAELQSRLEIPRQPDGSVSYLDIIEAVERTNSQHSPTTSRFRQIAVRTFPGVGLPVDGIVPDETLVEMALARVDPLGIPETDTEGDGILQDPDTFLGHDAFHLSGGIQIREPQSSIRPEDTHLDRRISTHELNTHYEYRLRAELVFSAMRKRMTTFEQIQGHPFSERQRNLIGKLYLFGFRDGSVPFLRESMARTTLSKAELTQELVSETTVNIVQEAIGLPNSSQTHIIFGNQIHPESDPDLFGELEVFAEILVQEMTDVLSVLPSPPR